MSNVNVLLRNYILLTTRSLTPKLLLHQKTNQRSYQLFLTKHLKSEEDLRALFRRVSLHFLAFSCISVPVVAIVQGAYLLFDYRKNHGTAPRPLMPSRGMVVATTEDCDDTHFYKSISSELDGNTTTDLGTSGFTIQKNFHRGPADSAEAEQSIPNNLSQREKPPLRLLVIGDSLAAGVGTSKSSTPVLPEAIALALSKAMGGRPIYWNCVGVPGSTSGEIVEEIYQLDDETIPDGGDTSPATQLLQRLQDWQHEARVRARYRYEISKLKAQEWLENRRQNDENRKAKEQNYALNQTSESGISYRLLAWWQETRDTLTKNLQTKNGSLLEDDTKQQSHPVAKKNRRRSTLKRRNTLDPSLQISKYDIAVVLTGLNDLKASFLPFMVQTEKQATHNTQSHNTENVDVIESEGDGIKLQLLRILDALRNKMKITAPPIITSNPTSNVEQISQQNDDRLLGDKSNVLHKRHQQSSERTVQNQIIRERCDEANTDFNVYVSHQDCTTTGPLVVFPALPYAPIELAQWVPLRWFLIPLLRSVDSKKELLAKMYPDLVLYVDYPNDQTITDAESRTGPLWDGIRSELVHLNIKDVTKLAQERILRSMKQHYNAWVRDADDDVGSLQRDSIDSFLLDDKNNFDLYMFSEVDGVSIIPLDVHTPPDYLGSTLVAADGIHPNDHGYEMWGRHIAGAIVQEILNRRKHNGPNI